MAYLITDVELVVALAVLLIIVYVIGSYSKHKQLTRYAHWFEDRFTSKSKVQFASYGHAGLRVKCEMTDKSDGFRELHFALTLGARENLMHYPLIGLMRDFDRLNFWGIIEKPIGSNLRIMYASDKKQIAYSENNANLRKLEITEFNKLGYSVYASNRDYATKFLSQALMPEKLKQIREVELIELEMNSSTVRVTSRLREKRLPSLADFILSLGRAA